jgi:hypothetical protein
VFGKKGEAGVFASVQIGRRTKQLMTTLTKTLLGLAIVCLAIGFTTNLLWGFGKPAGAIFFGLFMISKMLEKEIAKFDCEEIRRLSRADNVSASNAKFHSHEDLRVAA